MNNPIKLLLVDDDAIVRSTVSLIVSRAYPMAQISLSASLEESINMIKLEEFNLVILDMNLGKDSGLSLLHACINEHTSMPVLAMSSRKEKELVIAAFRAGAKGFICKDQITADSCLKDAIDSLLNGKTYVDSDFSSVFIAELQSESSSTLSEQEQRVMILIGTGFSVKEIASKMNIAEKTVRTYRARLLEKLNLSSDSEVVRYAIQSGFIN